VRTYEIKLQLNNAAGGRLYFMRPHIPETEIKKTVDGRLKRNSRPSVDLFHYSFISPCATGFKYLLNDTIEELGRTCKSSVN